jgi:site-specific DNA-methyltransferase (adenine-specific)
MQTDSTNIVSQLRRLTGITPEALARKVGAPASEVRGWESGVSTPPSSAHAVLQEMLERTQATEAASAPRVSRPRLSSAVVCANSLEYLREVPDESVELIVSDIPYGIGLDDWDVLHKNTNSAYMGSSAAQKKAGKVFGKRRKPINGWSAADREIPREYHAWCSRWGRDWLRVLKPGGSAFVFAGRRLAHRCVSAMEDAGFNCRDMLAWLRPRAVLRAQRLSVVYRKRGELAEADRWDGWRVGNLRPTFEPIIWCFKPYAVTIADNMLDHQVGAFNLERFAAITGEQDNVLRVGFEPGEQGLHPAQKPVALMRTLIETCSLPGQMVLDPFAGSGTTAVAAKACGRLYLAVELDPRLCEVTRGRLARQNRG